MTHSTSSPPVLQLQAEQLRLAATRFTETGNDLLTVLTQIRRELDNLDAPWGDDDPGRAFARDYLPAASKTIEAVGLFAGALGGIGTGLRQMGDTTTGYDHTLGQSIDRAIGQGMPGPGGVGGA
jgi:hypothetical protein